MSLTSQEYCDFLQSTQLDLFIPIPESSNDALLCSTEDPDIWCVYKPQESERPLYDFPQRTLAQREVASYQIAHALGMYYIPPTVLVEGPYGVGSIQLWVGENPRLQLSQANMIHSSDKPTQIIHPASHPISHSASSVSVADFSPVDYQQVLDLVMLAKKCPDNYLPVMYLELESEQELILAHEDTPALEEIAFLDLLLNNADRKGSHILAYISAGQNNSIDCPQVWALDHGLCLHSQWKLRTVLWGFSGRKLSNTLQRTLHKVPDLIANIPELPGLLSAVEIKALLARAKVLAAEPVFPSLYYSAQLPWPWF